MSNPVSSLMALFARMVVGTPDDAPVQPAGKARTDFPDDSSDHYDEIIVTAANTGDRERQRQAISLLKPPAPRGLWDRIKGWILSLAHEEPTTAQLVRDLSPERDTSRLATLQRLIASLRKGEWSLRDAAAWQNQLNLDEIFAIAAALPDNAQTPWLCALLLTHRSELAAIVSARLQAYFDALPENVRAKFGQSFNLALHNEILRQRSLNEETLNPDHPMVVRPEIYLELDVPREFLLSRHPDPDANYNDLFPEQAIFMQAPAFALWEYASPSHKGGEHPLGEVRRRAIEYLELSFLKGEDTAALVELAEYYYHDGDAPHIRRETKMIIDVIASLDTISEQGPNRAYEYVSAIIDYELSLLKKEETLEDQRILERRKFSINRFVRSALMIDPVLAHRDLPRWREAIRDIDKRHYKKFGQVREQLEGMLYEKLPPHLVRAIGEERLRECANAAEWLACFDTPEKRRELYTFLSECFQDKVTLGHTPVDADKGLLNHGNISVTALKIMTSLGFDAAAPVILKEIDTAIPIALMMPSAALAQVSTQMRERESNAYKALSYIRFLLSCVGRVGSPGVTARRLRQLRDKYLPQAYFGNSHPEAQINRTILYLESKGSRHASLPETHPFSRFHPPIVPHTQASLQHASQAAQPVRYAQSPTARALATHPLARSTRARRMGSRTPAGGPIR